MTNNTGGKIWRTFLAAMLLIIGANSNALAECNHATATDAATKSCCPVKAECQCDPRAAAVAHSNTASIFSIVGANSGCPCDLKSAPIDPTPAVVTVVPDLNIDLPTSAFVPRAIYNIVLTHAPKTSCPIRGSPLTQTPARAPPVLS